MHHWARDQISTASEPPLALLCMDFGLLYTFTNEFVDFRKTPPGISIGIIYSLRVVSGITDNFVKSPRNINYNL